MVAVLKWMFVLLLLIAVAGGGAAYWLYSRSDEGLRQMVLQQLHALAPTLKFDITRAQFDSAGRVSIYGLTACLPDDEIDRPSLEVPQVIATLESTMLSNFDVVVQKLYIVKPIVRAVRKPEGTWNWQGIAFQPTPGAALPEIEIEHASILTEFQLPDKPSRKLKFQNFNVTAHPADSRRFLIQVATMLEPAGPLTVEIETAIDGSSWKCESRDAWRVPVDSGLIQLLSDLSPQIAAQLAKAGQWMDDAREKQMAAGSITGLPAPSARAKPLEQTTSVAPDFGIRCVCDLNFRFQKEEPGSPTNFKVLVGITSGEINNALLPFSLRDLGGKVYVDNRQIVITDVSASNGQTKMAFNGNIVPSKPIAATMSLRGFELNNAVKSRLPDGIRKVIQLIGLTGQCDADVTLTQDSGQWDKQIDLRLTKGTITHERFPVTVREVAGKLHLEKNVVDFKATGKYAGQLVEAYGNIANPGPAQQADIVVKSNNLPLDDESLAACPPSVRKAIESLNLKGRHDLLLRIRRLAGLDQNYDLELNERVFDGSLCFNGFPLAIQQFQGFLTWKGNVVKFYDLKGIHDGAKVTGAGTFLRSPAPGRLDLTIDVTNAAFDRSLEQALPTTLRQVWSSFRPQGSFDTRTEISWVPGMPCEVVLPVVKVRDAEVFMTCFPWPLQNLQGEFSYNTKPGKLVMKEIRAQHDDTQLSASGTGWFSADNPWRLVFDQLNIDNLSPNETFRNALPDGVQRAFDFLRPSGTYSLDGPVEFFGPWGADKSVSAAWKLRTVLSRCAINAGRRVDEINGVAQLNGTWDGKSATLDGELDLDSVSVMRQASGRAYQITKLRGPISYRDNKFVAGMEAAIPPRKSDSPPIEKRIRGDVIDGKIFLDAAVTLASEPDYRAFVELREGRLERYAQQYLSGKSKLAGVMNGYMIVQGRGTDPDQMVGKGKLVIAPAALIELPLFVQIFDIARLPSADKSAFEEAKLEFTVGNSRFDLNSIELQGDTLKVRGLGYVRFDGGMQLDVGLTRRQLIPNPFKGFLIAVRVTGNVGDPKTRYVPLFELDDTMKQFFGALRMAPRPGVGQNEMDPLR